MKVAISASGSEKDALVDKRFARCPYFIIVDTDKMDFQTMENEHKAKSHGVGPQVVQTLSETDVDAVIAGNVGPNGYRTLNAADIKVYKGSGKVSEVVEMFKEGELEELEDQTVQGHWEKS